MVRTDRFGRLLSYPGKIEITCPIQDEKTAVLLLVGQSNAANYQGQRHQSVDDRVVNFLDGRCYRAASPLLGADGQKGETGTLLGNKLVQSRLYRTVILIPAAVGGSSVRRWAEGGGPQRDAGGRYPRGQGTLHHHRGAPGPGGDRFRLGYAREPVSVGSQIRD
jgi:Carbohydrate esterase, sialic acid-specific acetylesterase